MVKRESEAKPNMIDYDRTLSVLGVDVNKLSYGSKKKVFAICEDCGKYREIAFRRHHDLCKSCGHKRQHLSDETREKMSKTHSGKNHSEETKQKISKAHIGRHVSDETRKKLSEANMGKKHLDESIQKMSESTKGTRLSDETKKKISEAHCGRIWPEERRRKQSASRQNIPYDAWESYACEQKYCPKFNNECRESNREKYGRRCFICGLPESKNITSTGRRLKLSVHHVDMDKSQGCDGVRWKLVPVCLKHHSHNGLWTARIVYLLNNVWRD